MDDDPDETKYPPIIIPGVGVSLVRRKNVGDRISLQNLHPFLVAIGWIVNYDFDDADWQTLSNRLVKTDLAHNKWCEYELLGSHSARLQLARDPNEYVYISLNLPVEMMPQARLALDIFSTFHLSISR
jgi:hypothetical protein